MKTPVCRHCSHPKVNRPKGLCWSCYYTPGVKEMYPSTSKYARRGIVAPSRPKIPANPCPYPPGTPEKTAEVERRALAGEQLWHPDDADHTAWNTYQPKEMSPCEQS